MSKGLSNGPYLHAKEPINAVPHSIQLFASDVVVGYRRGAKNTPEAGRETVGTFSRKSRSRLAFVANNTSVEFRSIVTLTYPADFPDDGELVKRHLRNMLMRFRRRYAAIEYLWFIEFQKRGAPHFHILLSTDELNRDWLSASWYIICAGCDPDPRHLAAGTNWSLVRSPGGLRRYAVKYASKLRQKDVPLAYQSVGRFWGHSRGVAPKPISDVIILLDPEELWELLERWPHVGSLCRPLTTLYNASDYVFDRLVDHGAEIDGHLTLVR
jgi:hypothetical protein